MQEEDVRRAVAAATSIASAQRLTVDEAVVLQSSNALTLRLLPCDVVARIAHRGQEVAHFEVELALRLAETGSPAAALDPRVEPRPYEADGFVLTLWTYYAPAARGPSPAEVADALVRLHDGMRAVDRTAPRLAAPHHTDRVAEAQALVADPARTPGLAEADRALLVDTLRRLRRAVRDRGAPEQLVHGEPHPGNVLGTADGVRFIDLETCCRGPVEFDVAHLPAAISAHCSFADDELLADCRGLVLAMVAAWRWDPADRLPGGRRAARDLLQVLRDGPPWPTLDVVMPPVP